MNVKESVVNVKPPPSSSSKACIAETAKDTNTLEKTPFCKSSKTNDSVKTAKAEIKTPNDKISPSHVYHDSYAKGEAMTAAHFTEDLSQLILDILNGDITPNWIEDKKAGAFTVEQRQQFKLFGRDFLELLATHLAALILHGEEKDIEKVVNLAQANPGVLRCRVRAKDYFGRTAEGTLVGIALMAGNMNLQEKIREEKNRGAAERLIQISNLSKEEVVQQLKVIVGEEAKQKNEQRNQRVLTAVKKFGEDVLSMKGSENMDFKTLQIHCQPLVDQLEKALQIDTKEVITSGYIFDPKILHETAKWFEEHNILERFGGWWSLKSKIFWINGWGLLQKYLSAHDGHVARHGVGNVVNAGEIPLYTWNNCDGLGRDFYLGYYRPDHSPWDAMPAAIAWKTYTDQRQQRCEAYATFPRCSIKI